MFSLVWKILLHNSTTHKCYCEFRMYDKYSQDQKLQQKHSVALLYETMDACRFD